VVELGHNAVGIEVKLGDNVDFKDAKNLLHLKEYVPNMVAGVIIYNGNSIMKIARDVIAIPWQMF
jgi:hypothetical protein